jgi:HAD superfamily hydrolase (TIGR01509 family)
VGIAKPSREYFLKVAQILGFTPKEMIFFDDKEENVLGAKSAGMHAFLFTSVNKAKKDLKALGVRI